MTGLLPGDKGEITSSALRSRSPDGLLVMTPVVKYRLLPKYQAPSTSQQLSSPFHPSFFASSAISAMTAISSSDIPIMLKPPSW